MSSPAALLDAIVRDALDPSYAEAASRSGSRPTRSRTATGAVLVAVVGALIGLAVFAQHKSVPAVSAARTALAGDAAARSRTVTQLEQALAANERELAALQRQQLQSTAAGRALAAQEAELSAAVGRSPLTGPGVTVTVADAVTDPAAAAPDAGSRPQGQLAGRTGQVTDRDLQTVVNALWAAGARAVAVGGVRLGPQTAIRTAGETILVDFTPLRSPYVITAVGGPVFAAAVQGPSAIAALGSGPAGSHPVVTIRPERLLRLAGATAASGAVSSARPIAGGH